MYRTLRTLSHPIPTRPTLHAVALISFPESLKTPVVVAERRGLPMQVLKARQVHLQQRLQVLIFAEVLALTSKVQSNVAASHDAVYALVVDAFRDLLVFVDNDIDAQLRHFGDAVPPSSDPRFCC
ncbi:hypothetical protein PPTG_20957 [Phytophthora nicotianae INRA-310]|uniref:Uncharacterized protein n=1 Tax=Phytophthora nicotianae (strain INRA-310) TaxID=761204 RepID=W2RBV7_PHYN3|nr:hypothetical protein PPTG_20957 [Phytophthora nicotianae INRA-310]ETN22852.1 hypothetical protein PPTG_20957 [Phytophthora nicotianae INRA-310]